MRCGRGSKYMKMPGRCPDQNFCQKVWEKGKAPSGRSWPCQENGQAGRGLDMV